MLDEFAARKRWLMSVGPEKGPLVRELAGRLPDNARGLELGAYCGYSSIMIATALGPQSQVISIEIDENAVASATANVEVAASGPGRRACRFSAPPCRRACRPAPDAACGARESAETANESPSLKRDPCCRPWGRNRNFQAPATARFLNLRY